ncbi:MAG: hypothetical protein HS115_16135 [Spirochaetales bacterium]|nr:hypothetical protein [Spirochaetales bacterium]
MKLFYNFIFLAVLTTLNQCTVLGLIPEENKNQAAGLAALALLANGSSSSSCASDNPAFTPGSGLSYSGGTLSGSGTATADVDHDAPFVYQMTVSGEVTLGMYSDGAVVAGDPVFTIVPGQKVTMGTSSQSNGEGVNKITGTAGVAPQSATYCFEVQLHMGGVRPHFVYERGGCPGSQKAAASVDSASGQDFMVMADYAGSTKRKWGLKLNNGSVSCIVKQASSRYSIM